MDDATRRQMDEFLGFGSGRKRCPEGEHKDEKTGRCLPIRKHEKPKLWLPRDQSKARQGLEARESLMAAMTNIVGEEGTGHEQCPDGSHWNEKTGGCKKVPGALRAYVKNAAKQTVAANATRGGAEGMMAHSKALAAHMLASQEAEKRGFKGLAGEHQRQVATHHVASAVAARKAGAPTQPGGW